MANTVWFDVTRIHGWTEPPVGIIRVQLEIARRLLSEFGTKVRFCRFERRGEMYVEASPVEVDTYIRRLDANAEGSNPYSYNGVGWKAKDFIKKKIQYLPKRFQTVLIQFVRGLRRTVRKATRIFLRSIYRRLVHFSLLPPGIDTKMKQGDIYVNLDLDLDADTFARIYETKRKLGITGSRNVLRSYTDNHTPFYCERLFTAIFRFHKEYGPMRGSDHVHFPEHAP